MTTYKTTRLIIAMQEIQDALFAAFMSAVENACEEAGLPELPEELPDGMAEAVADALTDLETLGEEDDPGEAVADAMARVVEAWQAAQAERARAN